MVKVICIGMYTSNNKYIFWGIGIHLLCMNIQKRGCFL